MWALCTGPMNSELSWPWHGLKRWESVRAGAPAQAGVQNMDTVIFLFLLSLSIVSNNNRMSRSVSGWAFFTLAQDHINTITGVHLTCVINMSVQAEPFSGMNHYPQDTTSPFFWKENEHGNVGITADWKSIASLSHCHITQIAMHLMYLVSVWCTLYHWGKRLLVQ